MSVVTSLANTLQAGILETILSHLAALFLPGTAGDPAAARHAASQMLASYRPETEDERRLAAAIISFSLQALDSLGQAATPDLPLTKILRLRSSAVSLSRESDKAQRRLEHLQQTRRQTASANPRPAEPTPEPKAEPAPAPTHLTWTKAYEQRQRDLRIAASLKRAEARVAAHTVAAPATPHLTASHPA